MQPTPPYFTFLTKIGVLISVHYRRLKNLHFRQSLAVLRFKMGLRSDEQAPRPPLALSVAEQDLLLGILDSERFALTQPSRL